MSSGHYDAIIIGAGMSGLAAAIRLAYFDKKVCVLERHYAAGGLNSFYALGGHQFDVGLHAMTNYVPPGTRGAPLTKIYRQLRLKPEDFGLAPQYRSEVRFPGVTLRFTNDFDCFTR
ncbi:MAG TPA: FAD-dependent oxidoreductase, partial [Gemmatimonadales bacterium]|nr:FAD-dependent oxidoreductase [Gemmatimonadales bacterium]